jgi:ammonium transporter Rh
MMLIGFGYLMAFSKTTSWSAFSYTFFMNALMPQLYILLSGFWRRVLVDGFTAQNYYIYINEETFLNGLYSAASMFVNIGCTIGRVGPQEIWIMCIIHEFGYTLNEVICYDLIKGFDVGGSMTIHVFGAYGGLTVSLFLAYLTKPNSKPQTNYTSNIFAFIGTLFLWMYWPSFNFGINATTPFTKTQIISNTILALTGSCLSTFMTSAFLKNRFTMEHLLNATLSGGVVIGAAAGILFNPGGALCIGFLTGIISTLGFQYLTPYL